MPAIVPPKQKIIEGRMSPHDLGCVKTPKVRGRLEWSFSYQSKSTALEIFTHVNRDLMQNQFYEFCAPPHFHTTRTQSGHYSPRTVRCWISRRVCRSRHRSLMHFA